MAISRRTILLGAAGAATLGTANFISGPSRVSAEQSDRRHPRFGDPSWEDMFDQADGAPDPNKWNVKNYVPTDDGHGWFGHAPDSGVIRHEQSYVENGQLHMRGTWRDEPLVTDHGVTGNPTYRWMDTSYMDHRIGNDGADASETIYSQQYGRWEIKWRTPTGPDSLGYHCAFWLRNNEHPGEIDLTECWGFAGSPPTSNGQVPGSSVLTFHSSTMEEPVNGKPYQKELYRVHEELGDYSDNSWEHISNNVPLRPSYAASHVYGFEYMPDYISADFDGEEYMRTTPTKRRGCGTRTFGAARFTSV